jgi:hypothetical protein
MKTLFDNSVFSGIVKRKNMKHTHDEPHPHSIKIGKSTALIFTIVGFIVLVSYLYSKTTRTIALSTLTVLTPQNSSTDSFYYINTVVYLPDFKDSVYQYYLWDRRSPIRVGQNVSYGLFLEKDEQMNFFKLLYLESPNDSLKQEGKLVRVYNGVVKNWNTVPIARRKSI